jgi:hypothetical protein
MRRKSPPSKTISDNFSWLESFFHDWKEWAREVEISTTGKKIESSLRTRPVTCHHFQARGREWCLLQLSYAPLDWQFRVSHYRLFLGFGFISLDSMTPRGAIHLVVTLVFQWLLIAMEISEWFGDYVWIDHKLSELAMITKRTHSLSIIYSTSRQQIHLNKFVRLHKTT